MNADNKVDSGVRTQGVADVGVVMGTLTRPTCLVCYGRWYNQHVSSLWPSLAVFYYWLFWSCCRPAVSIIQQLWLCCCQPSC